MRKIVILVVAADSPAARAAPACDELTTHLPPPDKLTVCPRCAIPWPCPRFDTAAHHLQTTGLRLPTLIPPDLHPLLWPPTGPHPPLWAPNPHPLFDLFDHDHPDA